MRSQRRPIVRKVRTGLGIHYALQASGTSKPYTQSLTECTAVELRGDDRVVDLGSYIGEFALHCARVPVRSVTAYEPTPQSFEVVCANLRGFDNARAIQAAVVGDDRRSLEFYIARGTGTRNRLRRIRGGVAINVRAVSYLEVVANATVVKIDTEGAEWGYPILEYLDAPLRAIMIEFHPTSPVHKQRTREIIDGLESAGFDPAYSFDWDRFLKHGKRWGAHGAWVHPKR